MTTTKYTFAKFSDNPFYGAVNGHLVDMANLQSGQQIVDLACGTGSVTQLIVDRLRGARNSVVIAMDHSATALRQAMENLRDARDAAVQYVQSHVEQLSENIKESSTDTIFFCNAIHYVSDKDTLIAEVTKSLKPGGKFAFNTSFFDGGQPPESQPFYRKWMLKSSRILRREYGLSPSPSSKVESRKHLTAAEYRDLVERNGLTVVREEIDTVQVPLEGWLDISSFEDFIEGIMPGVPLDKASAALQEGVTQTYRELEIEHVPRNWLDVIAVRN